MEGEFTATAGRRERRRGGEVSTVWPMARSGGMRQQIAVAAAAGVAVVAGAVALVSWRWRPVAPAEPPAGAITASPRPEAAGAAPLAVGPISFFNSACASCHGDYGGFYGDGFAAARSDADLGRIVREMVAGPARSDLAERDMEALVAYHRSLVDGAPFLAWTSHRGEELTGEVTPGSTVSVVGGDMDGVEASVDGHTWRLRLRSPESPLPVLRAQRGELSTMLDLGRAAHSHGGGGSE